MDLRYNGGGNLNPMAEGMAGILGEGALGGWKGLMRSDDGTRQISNRDFLNAGYSVRRREPALPRALSPASKRMARAVLRLQPRRA